MFKKAVIIALIILIAGMLGICGPLLSPIVALAAQGGGNNGNNKKGNEDIGDYHLNPPFLTATAPPLVMLVMGRDHKLYYEAYNDASDLNGDGAIDVGYKPDDIDYYGYFDSYTCYTYQNSRFEPTSVAVASTTPNTNGKACAGVNEWSGDFLNFVTMSRMDALRKVLYGGYRELDPSTSGSPTVLERAYIPWDAHAWGKEYMDFATDGYYITDYTPLSQPSAGTRHLFASATDRSSGEPYLRYLTNESHRIWDWVTKEINQADDTLFDGTSVSPTDRIVKVKVCDPTLLESNCKRYPGADGELNTADDVFKPIGLLQRYGETEQMLFGLITGSFMKNTSGGVVRKNISLITDEIDADTGEFEYKDDSKIQGIIKTIDNLRIYGRGTYRYTNTPCGDSNGYVTTRPINEGECRDWGNPIAEMMYEGLRYFAGTQDSTDEYDYGGGAGDDSNLGLPYVSSWDDPYAQAERWCSNPFMLVISDIYPSYDSDQLPGSAFNSTWNGSSLTAQDGTSLNVDTVLDAISSTEGVSGSYFVGDSKAVFDASCKPKNLTSLSDVRGLCPEEPTKRGSYYSAAVAHFGHTKDLSAANEEQKVKTFTVGLSSPLPKIEIPIQGQTITLVPMAKSIYGKSIDRTEGQFQPTNTIVDFYVDTLDPANPTYGKFRISYEDVEQGADHDMDAMVIYEYWMVDDAGDPVADPATATKVKITLTSEYSKADIVQHMGYIISGTTADGIYLDVKSTDDTTDYDYFLDTPDPTEYHPDPITWNDGVSMPLVRERIFTPGAFTSATQLENPLYYAAKWGSFRDHNFNGIPDLQAEWDTDGDSLPDSYFYVQNPLYLEYELNKAFVAILDRASSNTAASVLSTERSGEGVVYQSLFYPRYDYKVNWVGELHAYLVDAHGNLRENTVTNGISGSEVHLDLGNDANLDGQYDDDSSQDLIVRFDDANPGNVRLYKDYDFDGVLETCNDNNNTDTCINCDSPPCDDGEQNPPSIPLEDIKYVWSASTWLNSISDTDVVTQRTYDSNVKQRHIFTFIDADNDMIADTGEIVDFEKTSANRDKIKPYLHLFPPVTDPPAGFNVNTEAEDQIEFIRGKDQTGMRSRQYDSDGDATDDSTYRLGDIVNSTPTAVGSPAENYDLLYSDATYAAFVKKYRRRRKVIYAGANDGMLHAFNGGFSRFNYAQNRYEILKQNDGGSEVQHDFGAELWAYVPFNLLPHLYWLTDPNYDHIYYVDLKPKVFDARIYNHANPATDKHPYGWATILVGGMRFGGGSIRTDMDHDGVYDPNTDLVMKSAYFVLDITDPEDPPELLAEFTFDELGYTTSYPGVILVNPKDTTSGNNWYLVLGSGPGGYRIAFSGHKKPFKGNNGSNHIGDKAIGDTSGSWGTIIDVIGSGNNATVVLGDTVGMFEHGETLFVDEDGDGNIDGDEPQMYVDLLSSVTNLGGTSSQPAKIYMVDLKKLAQNGELKDPSNNILTRTSNAFYDGSTAGSSFPDFSYIADMISVDLDLDYTADAVYFGLTSGDAGNWDGELRRIVLNDPDTGVDPTSPVSWDMDSVLLDTGQPISAAPTVAMDYKHRTWLFFGTGRFESEPDIADASQQTFYGLKEPWTDANTSGKVDMNATTNEMTWAEVAQTNLLDASDIVVFESGRIKNYSGGSFSSVTYGGNTLSTFTALESEMDKDPNPPGWKIDFSVLREKNLGQAALLGNVLTFTTYASDPDVCEEEGESFVYAVYYKTGTGFSRSIIGLNADLTDPVDGTSKQIITKKSLGEGLAVSPALHTGRETGSKAFIQTSSGAIIQIDEDNPGAVKSGKTFWMEP